MIPLRVPFSNPRGRKNLSKHDDIERQTDYWPRSFMSMAPISASATFLPSTMASAE